MASDASVRLSVSGISQFKSQMTSAKSSVKALDAELKLNAAEYKASGDAETYMANRARILSDQIKAQEDVVSACEKALSTMASQGVDKASASYTQMQAALAKAKTDLVQMQTAASSAGDELDKVSTSGEQASRRSAFKFGGGLRRGRGARGGVCVGRGRCKRLEQLHRQHVY